MTTAHLIFGYMLPGVIALAALVGIVYERVGIRAVKKWCEAEDSFAGWLRRNPGVYIGLSVEGRRLLCRLLAAHAKHLRWNLTLMDDREIQESHQEYHRLLESLFNDLPPKRRRRLPKAA